MMDQINPEPHSSQALKSSNHRLKSSPVLLRSKSTAPHPAPTMASPHRHKTTSKTMDLRRSRSTRPTGKNRDDPMISYGKNPECSEAIRSAGSGQSGLGLQNFTPLKKLGYGDIGCVYLVELKEPLPNNGNDLSEMSSNKHAKCWFAMKMMDKELLENRKKVQRVHTERDILRTLDHPFLPTLYADFETDRFACLLIEFCAGGDLHALRQKQPCKHFSESATRFYAAEVLLALEYLHMKGVIYRDLKPENILIREDGHIMLSDFDLSLQCAVKPTLLKSCSVHSTTPSVVEPDASQGKYPICMQPPCFSPKMLLRSAKSRLRKNEPGNQVAPLPEVFIEPTGTKSMSFVGTYEYIAPEIIIGEGHGSAVDWWTFGILLYELLYGTTPFKGQDNKATLLNILGKPLQFPEIHNSSLAARDLIRGLLVKDPEKRLGYTRGASEIKQHPFFKGINWALIRSLSPPEVPMPFQMSSNSLLLEMEKSDFGF